MDLVIFFLAGVTSCLLVLGLVDRFNTGKRGKMAGAFVVVATSIVPSFAMLELDMIKEEAVFFVGYASVVFVKYILIRAE